MVTGLDLCKAVLLVHLVWCLDFVGLGWHCCGLPVGPLCHNVHYN